MVGSCHSTIQRVFSRLVVDTSVSTIGSTVLPAFRTVQLITMNSHLDYVINGSLLKYHSVDANDRSLLILQTCLADFGKLIRPKGICLVSLSEILSYIINE